MSKKSRMQRARKRAKIIVEQKVSLTLTLNDDSVKAQRQQNSDRGGVGQKGAHPCSQLFSAVVVQGQNNN